MSSHTHSLPKHERFWIVNANCIMKKFVKTFSHHWCEWRRRCRGCEVEEVRSIARRSAWAEYELFPCCVFRESLHSFPGISLTSSLFLPPFVSFFFYFFFWIWQEPKWKGKGCDVRRREERKKEALEKEREGMRGIGIDVRGKERQRGHVRR